jgi:hypothetical protein
MSWTGDTAGRRARGVRASSQTLKAFRCDVRLDGLDLSGDYLLVEILNFGVAGQIYNSLRKPMVRMACWMSCARPCT